MAEVVDSIIVEIVKRVDESASDKDRSRSEKRKPDGDGGNEFDAVQQHLLETANKNGTNINALADVFRSASLGAHDLGASQSDLLKLTDAASNSLRIQGVSATKAQGSLLQLGHAFESGRVNAREFNSLALNLYPILQAAAHGSDQFGGSVAKLRQEIISGNVSSKIFFDAIIAGSGELEARAGKATLTTAQGFTSLTNALVVYFGEADKAQGVSAALGIALKTLGDNLNTLIPAIAAIGTALTVGYITRMGQAALVTARAAEATAGLGTVILGAFGGPVGLAITAITLGIGALVIESNSAAAASKAHAAQSDVTAKAIANLNNILSQDPSGDVANNAKALANARLAQANATYQAASAEIALRKAQASARVKDLEDGTVTDTTVNNRGVRTQTQTTYSNRALAIQRGQARNDLDAANRDQAALDGALANAKKNIADAPFKAKGVTLNANDAKSLAGYQEKLAGLEKAASEASGKRLKNLDKQIADTKVKISDLEKGYGARTAASDNAGLGGRSGASADTLAKRAEAERKRGVNDQRQYDADLRKAQLDYLQQQADIVDDGAKRADLERQRVVFAQEQYAKEIAAQGPVSAGGTGKFTPDQVSKLQGISLDAAGLRLQSIDQAETVRQATDGCLTA